MTDTTPLTQGMTPTPIRLPLDEPRQEDRPCAAWAKDILEHFEGARVTYLRGPGVERGERGEEGVQACPRLKDA